MADKQAQLWAVLFFIFVSAKILHDADDDDIFHHLHVTSSLL